MNSLIFIQLWFCHRSFLIDSGFVKSSPRAMHLASLRLKVPSLLLPHLSWSESADIRIFLYSRMAVRASAYAFKGELSL